MENYGFFCNYMPEVKIICHSIKIIKNNPLKYRRHAANRVNCLQLALIKYIIHMADLMCKLNVLFILIETISKPNCVVIPFMCMFYNVRESGRAFKFNFHCLCELTNQYDCIPLV